MGELISKTFGLKEASVEENLIKGNASVSGVIDRGSDVIFPGFWKPMLRAFDQDGFGALGHDWKGLPIIIPTKSQEKGNNLEVEGQFHSTVLAQETKTVCKERIEAGKSVGLSVGFMPDYAKGVLYFESGSELFKFISKDHSDKLDLFDEKQFKAHKKMCRALVKGEELYEWSVVTVPMNPKAGATEVRSFGDSILLQLESMTAEDLVGDNFKSLTVLQTKINELLALASKDPEDTKTQDEVDSEIQSRFDELRFKQLSLRSKRKVTQNG